MLNEASCSANLGFSLLNRVEHEIVKRFLGITSISWFHLRLQSCVFKCKSIKLFTQSRVKLLRAVIGSGSESNQDASRHLFSLYRGYLLGDACSTS